MEEGRCSSLIIVYGIMADKDLDSILPLMPVDATYIFAAPDTARALPAAEILKRFTAAQAAQQTNRSASASKPVPPLVFIGGSAFVVAEALPLFR